MELDIEQTSLPDSEDIYLDIVVRVKNEGTRNTFLQYDSDDHLTVTHVDIGEAGEIVRGEAIKRILKRGEKSVGTNTILAGSEIALPFFVKVPKTGLYHVRFYVRPNEHQLSVITKAGGAAKISAIVMSTNQYFIVR